MNLLHTIEDRGARFEAAIDLVNTAFPGNVISPPTRWIERPIISQASPRMTIGQPACFTWLAGCSPTSCASFRATLSSAARPGS